MATWDETKPAGGRNPKLGDDDIREFKNAIRERLALDHEFAATESPAFGEASSVIGMHKRVMLNEQSSDPTIEDNKGALYGKEVSAKCELHWRDEDDNILQITSAGALVLKGDTVVEKTASAGVTVDGVLIKDDTIKPTGTQLDINISGTKQIGVIDGAVIPITTNDIDLGTTELKFKNLHLVGDANIGGALAVTGDITVDDLTVNDDLTVVGDITVNSIVQGKDVTVALHRKVIEIGPWAMSDVSNILVPLGVTFNKVRAIHAIVRDDLNLYLYPAPYFSNVNGDVADFNIRYINNDPVAQVMVYRVTGGFFDTADFNASGSYNRGWVQVDYVD
jgi:hypothetical protein